MNYDYDIHVSYSTHIHVRAFLINNYVTVIIIMDVFMATIKVYIEIITIRRVSTI